MISGPADKKPYRGLVPESYEWSTIEVLAWSLEQTGNPTAAYTTLQRFLDRHGKVKFKTLPDAKAEQLYRWYERLKRDIEPPPQSVVNNTKV